jgi:nicotinate-nucleotide adenylyltransferase
MAPLRIAILGGTFDPIHLGHIIAAEYAYDFLRVDRLLLIPSASPVHRPRHMPAPNAHRLRMCQLAAAPLGPGFDVSDIEVRRPQPSYTVITLRQLVESYGPETDLYFLVGEDNVPLLHTWHEFRTVLSLAKIVPMPRSVPNSIDYGPLRAAIGNEAADQILARTPPAPRIPLSSTDLRARIHAGQSIHGLVPTSVGQYITDNGLYLSVNS